MSQEKALQTLENLGFTPLGARVYVLLAKRGPQKAGEIARCLKMPKQTVYAIIKNLQKEGVVTSTVERPARFGGVPFERVLDLFVKTKMEEAQRIQTNKDDILSDWKSVAAERKDEVSPKFTVIAGRNIIYSKIRQMIQQTNKHFSTITTFPNLLRADGFGLFEAAFEHQNRSKIQFRFLTELSEHNSDTVGGFFKKASKQGFNFEVRVPDLDLKPSRMVIRDDEEAMFFVNSSGDPATANKDDVCLWTDCRDLVRSFSVVFEDSWHNATDIEEIAEIKTGTPSHKTFVFKDADRAHKEYDEITSSAKKSIFILTSSTGLVEYWKRNQAEKWIRKGVSVRIMAPIVKENLEAAKQLLKVCEVKHVPVGYVGTTIVDGQHLFQFKSSTTPKELQGSMSYFEDTTYSDDFDFVEKTENMLNDIWKNALMPSTVTLESIINASAPKLVAHFESSRYSTYRKIIGWIGETEQVASTEKDILDKIINAKKIPIKDPLKEISIAYYSSGMSVIHPPACLNLPDMIIVARHIDKQSSMGAEDMLAVHLWLETPTGHAYVRAATVGDNPAGVEFRKKLNAGSPAENYCHLVREDEIQARLHGNTLFVGWTTPIPLYPPPFVLPPACLLFEGYGELKTGGTTTQTPSGHRHITEFNGFDAFVTFFHPDLKYSGPGTDGFLMRDVIMTSYPPK